MITFCCSFIYAGGMGPLERWMYAMALCAIFCIFDVTLLNIYGKSVVNGNEYKGKAPKAFFEKVCLHSWCQTLQCLSMTLKTDQITHRRLPQVADVKRLASTLADGTLPLLPMPVLKTGSIEYLATHPSHEHRCERGIAYMLMLLRLIRKLIITLMLVMFTLTLAPLFVATPCCLSNAFR
jgi:hypothetical protein